MKKLMFFLLIFIYSCSDNNTLSFIKYKEHNLISVSVYGHVKKEGTYLVSKDITLSNLEKLFNGYLEDAIKLNNNLKIKDHDIIFINSQRIMNKVDLNRASLEDLITIKGVGKSIASKILDYRLKHGNFNNLIELKEIKGIKDKLFKKIYEYLEVNK
ncbi:MAG: helix-hairpin-helix domain-containing protein [Bacilli bacterium]|jgi:competence protein ComEA|nr:helix-hairpin-helix domain-containing protein [Bacilli bacterium]